MSVTNKYTDNDLQNLIALCSQSSEVFHASGTFLNRCEKALAYNDVYLRLTKRDKEFLSTLYDQDMDPGAKETLEKIMGEADL